MVLQRRIYIYKNSHDTFAFNSVRHIIDGSRNILFPDVFHFSKFCWSIAVTGGVRRLVQYYFKIGCNVFNESGDS
uniref:Uncharacterized protein n=1 Tax=Parascaris equorum TaxID=6256 RepID=A0A914RW86_PAREQ